MKISKIQCLREIFTLTKKLGISYDGIANFMKNRSYFVQRALPDHLKNLLSELTPNIKKSLAEQLVAMKDGCDIATFLADNDLQDISIQVVQIEQRKPIKDQFTLPEKNEISEASINQSIKNQSDLQPENHQDKSHDTDLVNSALKTELKQLSSDIIIEKELENLENLSTDTSLESVEKLDADDALIPIAL